MIQFSGNELFWTCLLIFYLIKENNMLMIARVELVYHIEKQLI